MKAAIIGSGVYGLAVAHFLKNCDVDVIVWTEKEDISAIEAPTGVHLTHDYREAVENREIIFILTSSPYVEISLNNIKNYLLPSALIVLGSKGMLEDGTTFSKLHARILPEHNFAVISGPTFAKDIMSLDPIGFTIATAKREDYDRLVN